MPNDLYVIVLNAGKDYYYTGPSHNPSLQHNFTNLIHEAWMFSSAPMAQAHIDNQRLNHCRVACFQLTELVPDPTPDELWEDIRDHGGDVNDAYVSVSSETSSWHGSSNGGQPESKKGKGSSDRNDPNPFENPSSPCQCEGPSGEPCS